jgi:hypothetical protein
MQQSLVLLSGVFRVWTGLHIMMSLRKACISFTLRPSMTFLRNLLLPSSGQNTSTLMITAAGSSETLAPVYKITKRRTPTDGNLHSHCLQKLKPLIVLGSLITVVTGKWWQFHRVNYIQWTKPFVETNALESIWMCSYRYKHSQHNSFRERVSTLESWVKLSLPLYGRQPTRRVACNRAIVCATKQLAYQLGTFNKQLDCIIKSVTRCVLSSFTAPTIMLHVCFMSYACLATLLVCQSVGL